jgi:hypothetical protein
MSLMRKKRASGTLVKMVPLTAGVQLTRSVDISMVTGEPVEKPQQSILRRGGRADFVTPSLQITADMLGRRAASSHPPRSQSEMPQFFNGLLDVAALGSDGCRL